MIVRRPRLTTTEQIGNLRDGRASPRGRTPRTGKPWGRRKSREGSGSRAGAKEPMSWEDHESKRMEPAGSGATWTGSPKGVFAARKHHKPRLSFDHNTLGRSEERRVGMSVGLDGCSRNSSKE